MIVVWLGIGCPLDLDEERTTEPVVLPADPLPARVWRLTADEYRASVADLLGPEILAADRRTIADGQSVNGFTNGAASLQVRFEEATDFLHAAEAYSTAVLPRVPELCGCDPEPSAEEACARDCLDALGARAYRRPLTEVERERLWQSYLAGREPAFRDGIAMGIATMLVSPTFLYRSELGDPASEGPDGMRILTPHETAAAISFMMTGAPPDEALRADADADALSDPDQRAAHVSRLYPRAGDRLVDFVRRWLAVEDLTNLDKHAGTYPDYGQALLDEMVAETEAFIRAHLVRGDRRLDTLLTSPDTTVGERLAEVYGTAPGAVALDPEERAGLLTQALLLTRHSTYDSSAPVYRGAFVWRQLLCQDLPSPPPEAVEAGRSALEARDPVPPTTRERTEVMTRGEGCVSCHSVIDPIGFAFEHYDAIGALRATEGGAPIDASGALPASVDVGGPVRDGPDLAAALAESEDVQRCFLRRLTQHALGADLGPVDESGWLHGASESLREADRDLRAYLVGLARDPRFVQRRVVPVQGDL